MEWPMLEQIYLIFSRIFDGFINFLYNIFNGSAEE